MVRGEERSGKSDLIPTQALFDSFQPHHMVSISPQTTTVIMIHPLGTINISSIKY